MKKTDGLVELLAVEVGKFSIPSNKEITKLANSVRTYISGCLPKDMKQPEQTSDWKYINGWNDYREAVKQALRLGE